MMNNAGAMLSMGHVEWTTVDNYRRQCDVNLFGMIDVTMTFLPLVKKTRGRIVNTSSCSGRVPFQQIPAYSVSKYGVEAFSDLLRSTKIYNGLLYLGSSGSVGFTHKSHVKLVM